MPLFSKGIILPQHKEPALSRPIVRFVNPSVDSLDLGVTKLLAKDEQKAIIEVARLAQIVDERDGRLLHEVLTLALKNADIVIADAVDDEPYVSSRLGPLLAYKDEVVNGLELCCLVGGCEKKAIMAYKMITDTETRIPNTIEKIKVTRIRGGYPAASSARFKEFGPGQKLVVGTGALIHFARAIYKRKKQTSVFVTVAGNCVANSMNLEVSLGMTVMQVLERCGLSDEPTRIVCGGSMTGISIIDADKTLVTHTTRAILAVKENERDMHYSCIGCGRCEQVCPAGLNPMYIRKFVSTNHYGSLEPFDSHLCTGCGTCSYICPSRLEVVTAVEKAKDYALRNFVPILQLPEKGSAARDGS